MVQYFSVGRISRTCRERKWRRDFLLNYPFFSFFFVVVFSFSFLISSLLFLLSSCFCFLAILLLLLFLYPHFLLFFSFYLASYRFLLGAYFSLVFVCFLHVLSVNEQDNSKLPDEFGLNSSGWLGIITKPRSEYILVDPGKKNKVRNRYSINSIDKNEEKIWVFSV